MAEAGRHPAPGAWRLLLSLAAAGLLAVGVARAQQPPGATPVQVVERLHAALLANMSAGEAPGFEARLAHIAPVVADSFDFDTITRVALGDTFDTLDEPTRTRFRELLERKSALTYADNFKPPAEGERFVTVSDQPVRGGRVLVRTHLEEGHGDSVDLDYVLHQTPAGMRIINVLADGVSDLSLKRAQYAAVIHSNGVEELLRRLEDQVRDLAAQAGSG